MANDPDGKVIVQMVGMWKARVAAGGIITIWAAILYSVGVDPFKALWGAALTYGAAIACPTSAVLMLSLCVKVLAAFADQEDV